MEKTVSAAQARRQFGKLLDAVATCHERVIIERHGEPAAVLVPVNVYQQWQELREAAFNDLFALIERAQANANLSEEEADALAAEAVAAVRAEHAGMPAS
jgi:prevent-host-death family protein